MSENRAVLQLKKMDETLAAYFAALSELDERGQTHKRLCDILSGHDGIEDIVAFGFGPDWANYLEKWLDKLRGAAFRTESRASLGSVFVLIKYLCRVRQAIAHILKLPKQTATKRRGPKRKRTTALTKRDREILTTYSDCDRNAAEAGRRLKIPRQYVWDVVQKSKALFAKAGSAARSVSSRRALPTTNRGEPAVSEQAGTSDKGVGRRLRVKRKF